MFLFQILTFTYNLEMKIAMASHEMQEEELLTSLCDFIFMD